MDRIKNLSILNFIAFIFTLIVNILADKIPIGNVTTREISDLYPNLFSPAPITFSIWILIYILLLIFAIYQLIIAFKGTSDEKNIIEKIGLLFFISCIANSTWIFAFHSNKILVSLILMIAILISLINIYDNLEIGKRKASKKIKYMVFVPFSVYLGWICIAIIANISVFLTSQSWNGWGISPIVWTIIVIIFAILLGLLFIYRNGDIYYGLVICWGLFGIYLQRVKVVDKITSIIAVLILGMVLLILSSLYKFIKREVY